MKLMRKAKRVYATIPSPLKILILNGGIMAVTFAITDIEDGRFQWVDYTKILFGTSLNILVHLKLKEETNGSN